MSLWRSDKFLLTLSVVIAELEYHYYSSLEMLWVSVIIQINGCLTLVTKCPITNNESGEYIKILGVEVVFLLSIIIAKSYHRICISNCSVVFPFEIWRLTGNADILCNVWLGGPFGFVACRFVSLFLGPAVSPPPPPKKKKDIERERKVERKQEEGEEGGATRREEDEESRRRKRKERN